MCGSPRGVVPVGAEKAAANAFLAAVIAGDEPPLDPRRSVLESAFHLGKQAIDKPSLERILERDVIDDIVGTPLEAGVKHADSHPILLSHKPGFHASRLVVELDEVLADLRFENAG